MPDSAGAPRPPEPPPGAVRRLHAALMPDYNRPAAVYWWSMVLLGTAACARSLWEVSALSEVELLQLAGGVLLAMVMALFPLKIPRTNQVFTIGDLFIFLLLLSLGAGAACLAASLEALVSAWRSSRRWTTRLGSASIAAVSMFVCGHALQWASASLALDSSRQSAGLVLAAMVFGVLYFACNALLMSTVARLKRSQSLRWSDFISIFGWVASASAGSAAAAALLHITQRQAGLSVMLPLIPIIALLLTTLHFFSRQQEADEAAQRAAAKALEHEAELAASQARQREAELAAQHLRDLETSERRFHSAFTHASIGMALVSLDGAIHQVNPALRALLGCQDLNLQGRRFGDFVGAADLQRLDATLALVADGQGDMLPVEFCCRRTDGAEVWASISCSLFSEPDAAGPSLILQIQDITARRRAEAELQHRAFHDKLTGLPNRECFHDALTLAIARSDAGPGRSFAVLFLDFDRFKLINDSKGHTTGDEFLVQASRRLARCLRKGDLLARLGGDEFAILATGLTSDQDAVDVAERVLEALRTPLRLSTMEITATASLGITFSSIGYSRPEDMLRDADIAMYRAKNEGKARYALFDVRLHTELAQRVRLEGDLRQILLADQGLAIAYQPMHDLHTGKLIGFEALSRWTHPELGPVSPAIFIPIAEESGLITRLTDGLILQACRQLRLWHDSDPAFAALTVHVNVAARDVADSGFVTRVGQALLSTGLQPRHLVIELTENILMAQLSAAMGTLTALRTLGVGLSVDDFGTGYSSLSHLSTLPIDSLKIDMSFVRHLRVGSKEAAVIRAIVLLGTSLGKDVIAEGIETQAQMELLRDLGCGNGQGYHLSRPLPPEGIDKLLKGHRADTDRLPALSILPRPPLVH
ncbi:bifunctional diguanylate cyclase/phosphodiesterase [Ideonella sp. A 288]|uniref:putative bifunctional diguanylate cyclase/phosphodiesterase n=1 Tax=Ideonella sp. A 288 TaxID=1962181 RepID=UPI000B4B6E96|nr:EAL domain-containing protein [Ideonella sp. A 288]